MSVRQPENLLGQRFGRLVVIAPAARVGIKRDARWLCRCDCGAEKAVGAACLKSGRARSCSCLRREVTAKRMTVHGDSRVGKREPLYGVWAGILRRCNNPHDGTYERYGARGIRVCERWLSYENFKADMGPTYRRGLSIERNDNNGNYQPENCRWATRKEQCRNRRSSFFIEYRGERRTVVEWGEILGVRWARIHARIKAGWPVERAMTQPPRVWPSQQLLANP